MKPRFSRVISPGHKYEAFNCEDPVRGQGQQILFIRKRPDEDGNLQLIHDGTTNEALIEILVDRINHLNDKLPSEHNEVAMKHLLLALQALDDRTAERKEAGVEGTNLPIGGIIEDSEPIPEDMPYGKYLVEKHGYETVGQVRELLEEGTLAGLKYFNADRAEAVAEFLAP